MNGLPWPRGLLAAGLFAAFACKHEAAPAGAPAAGAGRGAGRGAGAARAAGAGVSFPVDAMPVVAKAVDYIVTAPGTLEAFERVEMTARVSGAVDQVSFSEGQEVHKGDVLVVIDSERYQLALNSAQASLDKLLASQKDTEAMVARREGASRDHPGLIPGEELESYRTKTLTAKADSEVGRQALQAARLNLRDAFVRAPIAGIIQTRSVETGQYVNTGYLMATLLRSDPLLLRFQVEPENAPRLKPGMPLSFSIREARDSFKAKITLVAAAADPASHTVPVTARVDTDSQKYWLRPGSFCEVSIDVGAKREAPVIPRSATRATDHGYIVYVVEDKLAVEKPVTLGMNTADGWVEIRTGLRAGDLLIVQGIDSVSSGAKVEVHQVGANQVGTNKVDAPGGPVDAGGAAP